MDVEGHQAAEMSRIAFDWVCGWLPQRLCNRRLQMAGREFGNGFERFRKLRLKYEGTGTIMDVAGADCLHQYPKCRSEKELEEHLDAWEEMLDKYGGQLIEYAPGHVRVMLIKTLPHEVENELLDHPELDSWERILDDLRRKLIYKHQKHLASYIKPGSARVHAVRRQEQSDSEDEDEPAPRGRSHTKAVKASMPSLSDPATIEAVVAAVMRRQGGRDRSSSRDKNKPKFIWKGGCHECGGDHFKRDCPKWVKLMKDHGDRMPDGHTNAYSKARDAFNKANGIAFKPRATAKPKARPDRKRVSALVTEELEESDFSSNDSEASFRTAMKTVRTRVCGVLPQPTPLTNTFHSPTD